MSKFRYRVETPIVESDEEFEQWLNHQGEGGWELVNTRVLDEEKDNRGNRKTYFHCIFKTKK